MERRRQYKHRLELADDISFGKKLYLDSNRQVQEVYRRGKKGVFKPTLNIRKKDLVVRNRTASEYGELIAHEIGKRVDIPACEADVVLYKMPVKYSKSGRTVNIPASISYIDLKPGEEMIHAISVLSWYKNQYPQEAADILDPQCEIINRKKRDYALFSDSVNCNIPLVLTAFDKYITERVGGSTSDCERIKQGLVDMIMFDCKFGNRDRHDENYGIAVSQDGSVRFYPTFDNEYILGLSEGIDDLEHNKGHIDEHIAHDVYSRMNNGINNAHVSPSDTVRFLFDNYPSYALKSFNKVKQFTESDLVEILDGFEGLDDIHKGYAIKIFKARDKELRQVYADFMRSRATSSYEYR